MVTSAVEKIKQERRWYVCHVKAWLFYIEWRRKTYLYGDIWTVTRGKWFCLGEEYPIRENKQTINSKCQVTEIVLGSLEEEQGVIVERERASNWQSREVPPLSEKGSHVRVIKRGMVQRQLSLQRLIFGKQTVEHEDHIWKPTYEPLAGIQTRDRGKRSFQFPEYLAEKNVWVYSLQAGKERESRDALKAFLSLKTGNDTVVIYWERGQLGMGVGSGVGFWTC